MQIRKIVLFKDGKQPRELNFQLGQVNVITGSSKSGKSVLIEIVDYCLGATQCNVSAGVVRNNVDGFGIIVVFQDKEQYLIARKNPYRDKNQTDTSAVITHVTNEFRIKNDILENANSTASDVESFLTQKIGIKQNKLSLPPTRPSYEVKFNHTKFACFQPQNVVANKDELFYRADNAFYVQSIKDTLPYLLGAIPANQFEIQKEISNLTHQLNQLLREECEEQNIRASESCRALMLIEEAKAIGLINIETKKINTTEAYEILKRLAKIEYEMPIVAPIGTNATLTELQRTRLDLCNKLDEIREKLNAVQQYEIDHNNYGDMVKNQYSRLTSIDLFSEFGDSSICPLCHHVLEQPLPSIVAMKSSLDELNSLLQDVHKEAPRISTYKSEIVTEQERTKAAIQTIDKTIREIYANQEQERKRRDLNIQRGKVIGKAELFVDSVSITEDNSRIRKIEELRNRIKERTSFIDKDAIQTLLSQIQARISKSMTDWARNDLLDIENNSVDLLFSPQKLTVYIKKDVLIPMSQTGSGANWVSFHLAALFALHKESQP